MEKPFLVLATQNPIEYEGTFPLPEAQLDRFLIRIRLGYPTPDQEITIIDQQRVTHPVESLEQVVGAESFKAIQQAVKEVYINDLVKEYIVSIVNASRKHPDTYLGASPRGSLALYRTGQARAALLGRDYVIPDDVKALAEVCLAHRIIISPSARIKNVDPRAVIDDILQSVPVPGARARATV
jgi:MoxR-like ATPase